MFDFMVHFGKIWHLYVTFNASMYCPSSVPFLLLHLSSSGPKPNQPGPSLNTSTTSLSHFWANYSKNGQYRVSLQSADLVGPISLSTGEQMRHIEARFGTLHCETPCVLLQELGWQPYEGTRIKDGGSWRTIDEINLWNNRLGEQLTQDVRLEVGRRQNLRKKNIVEKWP